MHTRQNRHVTDHINLASLFFLQEYQNVKEFKNGEKVYPAITLHSTSIGLEYIRSYTLCLITLQEWPPGFDQWSEF